MGVPVSEIYQVFCRGFARSADVDTYNKDPLRGDLSAGLTVAIKLIPQGMAYSVLGGIAAG